MRRIVLWDWNGTLLDDVHAAIATMNDLLAARGLPPIADERQYRKIFGFPVNAYYERAGLDLAAEPFTGLADQWMARYDVYGASCSLFDGARDVLEFLERENVRQIVLSASEKGRLLAQIAPLDILHHFERLLGIDDIYAQSKARIARDWLEREGADKRQIVMIGDTAHDFQVAQVLGCDCLLIRSGHQDESALRACGCDVLERIDQVPAALGIR